MRLIDADAYKDDICRNCIDVGCDFYGAKDISKCPCEKVLDIDSRPTAYDTNKVLEELNEEYELWLRGYNQTLSMGMEHLWRNLSGRAYGVSEAIEIVKRGGR